jgi:hypothetical protein
MMEMLQIYNVVVLLTCNVFITANNESMLITKYVIHQKVRLIIMIRLRAEN